MRTVDNDTENFYFEVEKNFDLAKSRQWFNRNVHLSIYISLAYVLVILAVQKYMSSKPAYNTKMYFCLWNAVLAVFSLVGTTRTLPFFVTILKNQGLRYSICDGRILNSNTVFNFWTFVFLMSKVPELGDTVFIVLRKQNLTFLHIAHHAITLSASWFIAVDWVPIARWFMVMNYAVHSVMYSYFTFRALGIKIPRFIAMTITTTQVIQMFVGFSVSFHAFYMHLTGQVCNVTSRSGFISVILYLFYVYLFGKFFLNNYFIKKQSKAASKND